MNNLEHYFTIGRAIAQLLEPLVEVVIHDTRTNKILFIEGGISKRSIGDDSLLENEELNNIEQGIYSKINFDGRLLKSISIPIKDKDGIVALMCINYDTSIFQELSVLTSAILRTQKIKKPKALFKNDWQDRINTFISKELQKQDLNFNNLSNKQKKEIIQSLFYSGAFNEKNAADYIAKTMNMGRATIFNYLREFKGEINAS